MLRNFPPSATITEPYVQQFICVSLLLTVQLHPTNAYDENNGYNPISIRRRNQHICTGQIISHRAALTTATCLQDLNGHTISVSLLSMVVHNNYTNNNVISVYRVATHSRQDLALLIVEAGTFTGAETISMSFSDVTAADASTVCTISGLKPKLQKQHLLSVYVIDTPYCRRTTKKTGNGAAADWICGAECLSFVDHGSALLCNGKLVGIALQTTLHLPTLFTSVSISRHWILYQQQETTSNLVRQIFVNLFLLAINRILCS